MIRAATLRSRDLVRSHSTPKGHTGQRAEKLTTMSHYSRMLLALRYLSPAIPTDNDCVGALLMASNASRSADRQASDRTP